MLFEIRRESDILGINPPFANAIPVDTGNGYAYVLDVGTLTEMLQLVDSEAELTIRHEQGQVEGVRYVIEIRDIE